MDRDLTGGEPMLRWHNQHAVLLGRDSAVDGGRRILQTDDGEVQVAVEEGAKCLFPLSGAAKDKCGSGTAFSNNPTEASRWSMRGKTSEPHPHVARLATPRELDGPPRDPQAVHYVLGWLHQGLRLRWSG
jgi:hypothetical protein